MVDPYTGIMKGVIMGKSPAISLIDITHAIPPGDVRAGAFSLLQSYPYFPKHTVFMVVVDPGVGTARRIVCVNTPNYCFLAPDNGVLSWALARQDTVSCVQVTCTDYFLPVVSQTFHGRDIFAPVAAHLANGMSPTQLGDDAMPLMSLPWPSVTCAQTHIAGEVLAIDHFGNLITSIHSGIVEPRQIAEIRIGKTTLPRLFSTYGDVQRGDLVALIGSSGYLEIAINGGHAAQALDGVLGMPVICVREGGRP